MAPLSDARRRAAALVAAALALVAASPAPLVVEVSNVRNARGRVHVDVCPESQFLTDDCTIVASAPAHPGVTRVTVPSLPAGTWAVQAFHDENGNGKTDRALFGIPKEGIGFSNDAPIKMSPPKWADARFTFAGGAAQTIRLKMRYFLGASGPAAAK